ncbi:MAG: hypothetical protein JO347_07400, partial [Candidatus Eremiobacteraeota bacterium]|nr:hypothetical protein [Candidatus Eremiobacteraeota bacterium]
MTGTAALDEIGLRDVGTPDSRAQLALPFVLFTLMPVLPMLVLLADVLPRGVAIGGKGYAVALLVITSVATSITLGALLVQRGWRAFAQAPLSAPLLAMIGTALLAGIIGVSLRASMFEILSEIGTFIAFVAIVWNVAGERVRRSLLVCYFTTGIAAAIFGIALTLTRHPP